VLDSVQIPADGVAPVTRNVGVVRQGKTEWRPKTENAHEGH